MINGERAIRTQGKYKEGGAQYIMTGCFSKKGDFLKIALTLFLLNIRPKLRELCKFFLILIDFEGFGTHQT